MTLRSRMTLGASLLTAALVAWIVAVDRMRGMDTGPGTDLGTLGWFIGIWVTMMAAMMLPSAAPTVLAVSSIRRGVEDRKSTRLNSGHVKISYAVFCLKKKKKLNGTFNSKEQYTIKYNYTTNRLLK